MLMNEVYETINEIYESRDVISIKSLKNMLENCPEIRKISYVLFGAGDQKGRPVYRIQFYEIDYDQDMYLWFYFYDNDNIAIQQLFGMNNSKYDINYKNNRSPKFDFNPIEVDRQYL